MQISKLQFKIKNFLKAKSYKLKAGFTLIEMLVAVAVFATAATISVGILLAASEAQQKILALRVVQDNLSYVFDTMGKEVRTGSSYHCGANINDFSDAPQDCAAGGVSFTFRNSAFQKITYRLNNGRMERVYEGGTFSESIAVLTAPDANIFNLKFYVRGAPGTSQGDNFQPRVVIVLQGTAGLKQKTQAAINIQTTISQRALDS